MNKRYSLDQLASNSCLLASSDIFRQPTPTKMRDGEINWILDINSSRADYCFLPLLRKELYQSLNLNAHLDI